MLPRAERIGTTEFRRAFENGRVLRGGLLQLRFYRRAAARDNTLGHDNSARDAAIEYSIVAAKAQNMQTRAAFVVSRKSGKATVRNGLRRRVREIYRLSAWRHDARLAGLDLLFFASATALTASNEALQHALNELLERAARAQPKARSFRPKSSSTHAFHSAAAATATAISPSSRGRTSNDELVQESPPLDVSPDAEV